MNAITEFGCVVCKKNFRVHTPAEVHHIDGKTKPGAHLNTIPLCYNHHRGGQDDGLLTSRHPHKARFEQRYGSQQELLDYVREQIFG